jgi:glycosyltransferase involved in cell wall biosynthesis
VADPSLRERLSAGARSRAAELSWANRTRRYWDMLDGAQAR